MRTHSVAFAAMATLLLLSPFVSCSCKTDAERAKEEREEVQHEMKESLGLLPYRITKMTLRSQSSPNRPEAINALLAVVEKVQQLPEKASGFEEVANEAKVYAQFTKAVWDARSTMMTRDEDEFPTLAEVYLSRKPFTGYDAEAEHLVLSSLWAIISIADQKQAIPGAPSFLFYETLKTTPSANWPPLLQYFARIMRGVAYFSVKRHYAADEELTASIQSLDTANESLFPGFGETVKPKDTFHGTRAAAYMMRAYNRMSLKREELAVADLEKGLEELRAMGVDNEVTQWGWAVVHAKRGRFAQAADEMKKLSESPYIEKDIQKELLEASHQMRTNGKGIPVLLELRATAILGQALLTRAGGVENILKFLLGKADAEKLMFPVRFLKKSAETVAASPEKWLNEGKEMGSKGLDFMKGQLEKLQASP